MFNTNPDKCKVAVHTVTRAASGGSNDCAQRTVVDNDIVAIFPATSTTSTTNTTNTTSTTSTAQHVYGVIAPCDSDGDCDSSSNSSSDTDDDSMVVVSGTSSDVPVSTQCDAVSIDTARHLDTFGIAHVDAILPPETGSNNTSIASTSLTTSAVSTQPSDGALARGSAVSTLDVFNNTVANHNDTSTTITSIASVRSSTTTQTIDVATNDVAVRAVCNTKCASTNTDPHVVITSTPINATTTITTTTTNPSNTHHTVTTIDTAMSNMTSALANTTDEELNARNIDPVAFRALASAMNDMCKRKRDV